MRTLIRETIKKVGETVELKGWVHIRRDHGKILFIDLRDRSGVLQVVFTPDKKALYEEAEKLRPEWVVAVTGKVNARPEKMVNSNIETGRIELVAEKLEVLNEAKALPIDVLGGGVDIGEESRMKYRYLDLRRPRMQKNIRNRDKVIVFFRDYLHGKDFVEIETPELSKTTPEGARDYLVPSRIYPGKFYALPQSPQQYKQLLMVAGFER